MEHASGTMPMRAKTKPNLGITDPYDDMVRKLTAAQIRDAAKTYFNVANYARFVLLPEK